MGEDEGDWFSQSLDEISKDVRNTQEEPMVRYALAQIKITRLQARVAFDTAKSQERLVRNLVRGTWALVIATLTVAAVAIWG